MIKMCLIKNVNDVFHSICTNSCHSNTKVIKINLKVSQMI